MFYILYIFSPQILLAFQEHAMIFPLASNIPLDEAFHSCLIDGISSQHRAWPLCKQCLFIQRWNGERKDSGLWN